METAAGVVGITAFAFQLFQSCIQAFQMVESAQNIGRDGDGFRSSLIWEKYRLMQWGSRTRVLEQGSPNHSINWNIANMLMEQMGGLLTSAETLKKRYNLDVTAEEIGEEHVRSLQAPERGISAFIAKIRPEVYTAASKIIQSRNGSLNRLKWATLGKLEAQRLAKDIATLNDKLGMLLDSSDREKRRVEDEQLLRALVSLTTTAGEVSQVEAILPIDFERPDAVAAIAAAAHLKQVRLLVGADKRTDEVQPQPSQQARETARVPTLRAMKRSLHHYGGQEVTYSGLEFAVHGRDRQQKVVIQWKESSEEEWERHGRQIKVLAVLLSAMGEASFRSLPCLGHCADESHRRYGIVYEAPGGQRLQQMTSLDKLMQSVTEVSLAKRLEIAKALAETVLQLHTAGWLHKGLKSGCIVFFSDKGQAAENALQTQPFVFGYDYAREDSADGLEFTELNQTDLVDELYRHPSARGHEREVYQKRFDMYALGCVLTELIFWKRLVDIHAEWSGSNFVANLEEAQEKNTLPPNWTLPDLMALLGNEKVIARMAHLGGDKYVNAIRACVYIGKGEEGQEASLTDQTSVVEILKACRF